MTCQTSKRTICQAFEKYCVSNATFHKFDELPLTHPHRIKMLKHFVEMSHDPSKVTATRLQPVQILEGNTGFNNARPSIAIADTKTDIIRIESIGDKQFELTLDLKEYVKHRVDEEIIKTMSNLGQIIDDMAVGLQMPHNESDATVEDDKSKLTMWTKTPGNTNE